MSEPASRPNIKVLRVVQDDWPDLKFILLIFSICLLVYLFFWSGKHYSIDGVVMFEYAKSLLQGSFIMDPPVLWGTEITVSKWPVGLTLLYMPLLAVLKAIFPSNIYYSQAPYNVHLPYNDLLLENTPYRYASLLHLFITAATAALTYVLSRRLKLSRKAACAAALIFGLASPAAVYARMDFAQPLASFCLLAALIFTIESTSQSRSSMFFGGLFTGFTILARTEMALIAGLPICAYVIINQTRLLTQGGRQYLRAASRLVWFFAPLLAAFALIFAFNVLRFGSLLNFGYTGKGDGFSLSSWHIMVGMLGTLFSPGRGIVFFFPLSLFSLVGILALLKRNPLTGALCLWLIGMSILLYSTFTQWAGGISWGPRFLVPILPCLSALAMIGYHETQPLNTILRKALFIFLLMFGFIINTQSLILRPLDYYLTLNLSGIDIFLGNYNFRLAASPVISGWPSPLTLDSFDSFWISKVAISQNDWLIFPIFISLCLAAMIFLLLKSCTVSEQDVTPMN